MSNCLVVEELDALETNPSAAVLRQFVYGNYIDEPLVMDVGLSRGGGSASAAARRSLRSTPGALGHDSSKTIGETVAGPANAASGIGLDLATCCFTKGRA